ncbi:MAG: superoxide dismutase family protein, partial [Verrucomicrobiales bacterium]|nr:superoxide dismutase family protein [Verrucomicrobiales bacterium]
MKNRTNVKQCVTLFLLTAVATLGTAFMFKGVGNDENNTEILNAKPALIAILTPTEGNETQGTVIFRQTGPEQVTVFARVTGLKPNQQHGIHIHEYGDISAADGTSAGGHFNPHNTKHGLPTDEERHAGDLGNLTADPMGEAAMTLVIDDFYMVDGKEALPGRAVVVHGKEDKGVQPTGDAGPRLATGVIGYANPEGVDELQEKLIDQAVLN